MISDPSALDKSYLNRALDCGREQARWNSEIVSRVLCFSKLSSQGREGRRAFIVSVYVVKQLQQTTKCDLIHTASELFNTVAGALPNSSGVHPDFAMPITGTLRVPCRTMLCKAEKIFLCARSPVATKKRKYQRRD